MVDVKFHDIGEGITEGEVIQYLVKIGEKVEADQPLVEVQTDKMTAELPSPAQGTITDIKVPEGEQITVGTTLLVIDPGQSATVDTRKEEEQAKKSVQIQVTKPANKKLVLAAPYTRKIARDLGVNIEEVTGTGPAGRITDEDVYRFTNESAAGKRQVSQESASASARRLETEEENIVPFKGRRKIIAEKMAKSLFTIPHVTHFEEADVTNVLNLTQQLKEEGDHVSVAAFFIKAVQIALQDFPVFNAVLDEENEVIKMKNHCHMGIAVDTEEGLIVPVIRHTERKSIKQIHDEMKQLIQKAQENRLNPKEMSGSTFTISNVGPLGSIAATPIINYPETGLMAFHKAKKRPAVVNDEITIRSMMNISMSFDHRVADGAMAVAFTNRFVRLIENPAKMLLELM
ncbi:pyruvate dehydrogenase E2 component (dihydrolipoamide acetyltransferase) [Bacillus thermophilus]|uniref:Dihydrolipoamide acetyltransferase component of pyruvate dehydrogenase complex n=1 Tax=Siminovitchia thermophila TaxID=1245522 RepID=A0ABS2R947_9BACI|nr:dihydrolipoamide acetyltransferase family protein [Siminovitchia thermophila]MBM7715126.1 pyruvate dehydrogenase E2 component (dihydrolipoamide acetyltransferase) [Siminovitchia thermophila]ONK22798.1 dihydrolipoyllysine acetyltransferase [Bacillus sp. VT-16-64]